MYMIAYLKYSLMPCKEGRLSSKCGRVSDMHVQPFSANASERKQRNIFHNFAHLGIEGPAEWLLY